MAVVSGRLSVTTPGTSMTQRWSVVSWGMDMPYWQYRVLPLDKDQAYSGRGNGTAMEMRPAWTIASAVLVPIAPILEMRRCSALAVVRLSAHTTSFVYSTCMQL